MKKIDFIIKTLSPVLISDDSGNPFAISTKNFIPGRTILGTFAKNYLVKNKLTDYYEQKVPNDPTFLSWFLQGNLNFSNANIADNNNKCEIVPFSIQYIKNQEKIIYDIFYTDKDEQTKTINAFAHIENGAIKKKIINKSYSSHHERDYAKGSVKNGIFFNYEAIDRNQTFIGCITGNDDDINNFYNTFSELKEINLGRSKTAEYGRASIQLNSPCEVEVKPVKIDSEVSLTLLSDLIIFNEFGYPINDFSSLEKYLKENISNTLVIKKTFLRTSEVENYISVWNLKRPSEVSFSAGSCIVFSVSEDIKNKIGKLQQSGFGERVNEGYGQIAFALQSKDTNYSFIENVTHKPTKPNENAPLLIKNITKKIAIEYFEKLIRLEAFKMVKENGKINITSSQIGRLEGFLRISKNQEDFVRILKDLRKTSKDKLEDADFNDTNFYQFLLKENIKNNNNVENAKVIINKLFNDVNIDVAETEKIIKDLYLVFYATLFNAIRKKIKGDKKR